MNVTNEALTVVSHLILDSAVIKQAKAVELIARYTESNDRVILIHVHTTLDEVFTLCQIIIAMELTHGMSKWNTTVWSARNMIKECTVLQESVPAESLRM